MFSFLLKTIMVQLLDEIAEKFYGVRRRNPMQGMFGDIFKVHPIRIWTSVRTSWLWNNGKISVYARLQKLFMSTIFWTSSDGWLVGIGRNCHYVFGLSTNYITSFYQFESATTLISCLKLILILKFADDGRWVVDGGNLILLCVALWELLGRYPK